MIPQYTRHTFHNIRSPSTCLNFIVYSEIISTEIVRNIRCSILFTLYAPSEFVHNLSSISYHTFFPLTFAGLLLLCAPCNPFTLPYNHFNMMVLPVINSAAPPNNMTLCAVSICSINGYG